MAEVAADKNFMPTPAAASPSSGGEPTVQWNLRWNCWSLPPGWH